ncbi:MAG: glycosyltransferase family 4 protein [Fuerstiella sp.]
MTNENDHGPRSETTPGAMRICFALPGLHRINRGAETAFESLAHEMARFADCSVTVFGSGEPVTSRAYKFVHVPSRSRESFENWPRIPGARSECTWEELTFMPGFMRAYDPSAFDVSVTCSYPYTNWFLRSRRRKGYRPAHVYVTQNGDWPCHAGNSEYRWFGCDGLVCTNPEYYERNRDRWRSVLIPNGVDPTLFFPGAGNRESYGLPKQVPIVLMVSALIDSKRIIEGIEAVSQVDGVHLVVAGDGPLREQVLDHGQRKLQGRFTHLYLRREQMPELYRCASIFLHMSLDEPSANAYIEALASGLPIVTHDRPVTRWTLEDCGVFANARNLTEVSAQIEASVRSPDPTRVERQLNLVAQRFTWRAIAGEYVNLFHAL